MTVKTRDDIGASIIESLKNDSVDAFYNPETGSITIHISGLDNDKRAKISLLIESDNRGVLADNSENSDLIYQLPADSHKTEFRGGGGRGRGRGRGRARYRGGRP